MRRGLGERLRSVPAWLRRTVLAVVVVGLAGSVAGVGFGTALERRASPPPRPNVVVVMVDDMRHDELRYMPKTQRLLGEAGTRFTNSVVSYPLCCPSRATLLTGQYAHNHGVTWNGAPGGYNSFRNAETLPVWLQRTGYFTAQLGKYLNGYGDPGYGRSPTEVPPGYDSWQVLTNRTHHRMYDYVLNVDGRLRGYGSASPDHQTDVLRVRTVSTLQRASATGQPFYVAVTPSAPHREAGTAPPRPAPRHIGAYAGASFPVPPSFNEPDVGDKPGYIAGAAPLPLETVAYLQQLFQARIESLLAVDDMVDAVVDALEGAGELDETLIIFTSDNGFMRGEHRRATDKFVPYEESIRVPLIIRGPGFPAGRVAGEPVVNVDLAATVLEATGARAGLPQDGRPLQQVAQPPGLDADRAVLLEAGPTTPEADYAGVRTPSWVFVRYESGEEELYDLRVDPYQLTNLAADPAHATTKADLDAQLQRLQRCSGAACREWGRGGSNSRRAD